MVFADISNTQRIEQSSRINVSKNQYSLVHFENHLQYQIAVEIYKLKEENHMKDSCLWSAD